MNVPSVNFTIRTQLTGNWLVGPVFCLMPGSRNGFASFQFRTAFMIDGASRVRAGLVQQLHEGVRDGDAVEVEPRP